MTLCYKVNMAMQVPAAAAVPRHVAIIMDGNRRWAAARGLPLAEGYRRGIAALRRTVAGALDCGVRELTVYGFSTENWRRDAGEIDLLMHLCALFAANERAQLVRQGVRVRVVGNVEPFAGPARRGLDRLESATARGTALRLNLALNYSGRAEILHAVRALAADVACGVVDPSAIDEAALRRRFYAPDSPDPDLLIRTGGDRRVSNFLLYQLAYTEIETLAVMWPDFDQPAFARAIAEYGRRTRRYGA